MQDADFRNHVVDKINEIIAVLNKLEAPPVITGTPMEEHLGLNGHHHAAYMTDCNVCKAVYCVGCYSRCPNH